MLLFSRAAPSIYSSVLHFHRLFKSTSFRCFCPPTFTIRPISMAQSTTSVVAEYAKSNRSTCKACAKAIPAKTLRLGSVSKDPRGYDVTKWHHFECYSVGSGSSLSVEAIKGFGSLKGDDQETLKKIWENAGKPKGQVRESSQDGDEETEAREQKKQKTSITQTEEPMVEISFSVSDIKETYKDATLSPKWKAFQTIIFLEKDDGLDDSSKIAAFDFDGCLVNTSVKRVGADAWSLMHPSVPRKLQELYKDGFKLVIFTNESNIERWKNRRQAAVDSKVGRLNNFIKRVEVPIQVFIACGFDSRDGVTKDPYRKPRPGMWHLLEKHFNSGIKIDMDQSFYVGDAAGRKQDHSDADIKFAEAVGLKFFVPEDYFC